MDEFKIENEDLYAILDISIDSTLADIKKAYRKKALQCHPDKNPDNTNAAKEFHQLTKILEVLSDESARSAYNKVLKGKKEAALRHKELDSKRRKLKEDLEARERNAFNNNRTFNKTSDQQLKEEIQRLQKEGSRLVEEEVEYISRKIREETSKLNADNNEKSSFRIKIKWKAVKGDITNGGYTEELLHRFLLKYGDVTALVVSSKKKGSALVEFNNQRSAEMAIDFERGLTDNPLELTWLDGSPRTSNIPSTTIKASDFESVVFTKMKQAEERKRLIEQMMAEDKESAG